MLVSERNDHPSASKQQQLAAVVVTSNRSADFFSLRISRSREVLSSITELWGARLLFCCPEAVWVTQRESWRAVAASLWNMGPQHTHTHTATTTGAKIAVVAAAGSFVWACKFQNYTVQKYFTHMQLCPPIIKSGLNDGKRFRRNFPWLSKNGEDHPWNEPVKTFHITRLYQKWHRLQHGTLTQTRPVQNAKLFCFLVFFCAFLGHPRINQTLVHGRDAWLKIWSPRPPWRKTDTANKSHTSPDHVKGDRATGKSTKFTNLCVLM